MRADARAAGAAPAATRPPLWYSAAWGLGLPLAALYLCWRALRQPDYLRHWGERFLGDGPSCPVRPIWLHAVSVGETRAAQALVTELARRRPDARFLLTHMTPTGRAAGAKLAQSFPGRVQQRYLPYDHPFAVRRFLRQVRPLAGVLMETEIWPNLLHAARGEDVPVVLASARLSPRSLAKALRQESLMRRAASCVCAVGAQSEEDRARIARLYDGPIEVTGNIKFDQHPDANLLARGRELRARMQGSAGARPIWLFASTRAGEERLLLDAVAARARSGAQPEPLLLIVPRHPQRFDEVAEMLRARGAAVLRRGQWESGSALAPDSGVVLLGDSMGEMPLYYAMADAAIIGGSLLPLGGQNLIEACACGCPVVLGPHMFNFSQASADAVAAGAALRAGSAGEAVECLGRIASKPALREAMSAAGLAFTRAHGGATARTVDMILRSLEVSAAAAR